MAVVNVTDVGAGLQGVYNASAAWGDYDNDGDLDILLTGFTGSVYVTRLYRSSGGASPTFSNVAVGLPNVTSGSVAWGDYDGDGDLDILLTGFHLTDGAVSRIYRNSGGENPTFADVGAGLTGVQTSSSAWGDYDNDGDLDFVLLGSDAGNAAVTRLYRSSGGPNPTFDVVSAGLENVTQGSVAWVDYDKDGDLDLLLTGLIPGVSSTTKLYRNSGGANPIFSDVGAGLTGVQTSSVAWGDYDSDGDLDLLLTGFIGAATGRTSKLYRSSGGANPTFSDVGAGLQAVNASSVAWGDYDTDGDLDILLTGFTGTTRVAKVYQNSGGADPTFSDLGDGLPGVDRSSVAWGDHDADGDLDVLLTGYDVGNIPISRLYRNDLNVPNTPPNAPGGLSRSTGASGTTFTWTASSDAQTPAAGLTYNLRVGTTPGGNEISSAMAAGNGYRRVVRLGNAQQRLAWLLRLPPGTYYWSVQALDASFAGSPFAAEQSFQIPGFVDVGAALEDVYRSSSAWGDYDNDGDLDIVLTGASRGTGTPVSKVYRNDGNSAFTDIGAGLTGVTYSSVAWGDYDNDGDLDILLTGADATDQSITKIYRNDAGSFTDIGAALTAVQLSAVAWGDYDNDGDLDILLTGHTGTARVSKLYRNDGSGAFTEIGAGLMGVSQGAVAWGDYDNDGDLDILLTGIVSDDPLRDFRIYRNEGGGAFLWVPLFAPGLSSSSVAWGDYDGDGDLDILAAGNTSSTPYSGVLKNLGNGNFFDIGALLTGVYWCSVAWGDFDNDGDLDILLTGRGALSTVHSKVYRYNGSDFFAEFTTANLTPMAESSAAWGDYDNDGDLDILLTGDGAKVYRTVGVPSNAPPAPPGNPSAVRNGGLVTFSWTAATDDRTPAAGLTYNLQVGTFANPDQRMPAMAAANGFRRVARLGNAQQRLSWTLALPPGAYYWNVQAIDGAFLGSSFSGSAVAVDEGRVPTTFELSPAAPNPFAKETGLSFALPAAGHVELAVFDLQGRRVRLLVRGERPAGRHRVQWDGRADSGARERNGVYLIRMTAAGNSWTTKLVLAR